MVSQDATTHTNRFTEPLEPVATSNGPRLTPLVEEEGPQVEVVRTHVTRAPATERWPRRHTLADLPRSTRVVVETPDGVDCPVTVRFIVLEGYVYAHGHQDYICRGENVEAGGEFPRACELLAESIALQLL